MKKSFKLLIFIPIILAGYVFQVFSGDKQASKLSLVEKVFADTVPTNTTTSTLDTGRGGQGSQGDGGGCG